MGIRHRGHQFRRVLKDARVETEWRPYTSLHLDEHSDAFTVVLNDAGTRMLRSWRHQGGACAQCGTSDTRELSVEDIAMARGG